MKGFIGKTVTLVSVLLTIFLASVSLATHVKSDTDGSSHAKSGCMGCHQTEDAESDRE